MTRTHEARIARWIGQGKTGVQVEPRDTPMPGLDPRPIYVDDRQEPGDATCIADYRGHACALPFHSNSLDYVIASHVLERVANPVAALAEWYRVLRPGGVIYAVVSDRRATWESGRPLTTVEHMLADYETGATACDTTHIDDFVQNVDWSRWRPSVPAEEVPGKKIELAQALHDAARRGEPVNVHFHTFEPENLLGLVRALRKWKPRRFVWEIVDHDEGFPASRPDGLLLVLRADKEWRDRAEADWFNRRTENDPAAVVREDATPVVFGGEKTEAGGRR